MLPNVAERLGHVQEFCTAPQRAAQVMYGTERMEVVHFKALGLNRFPSLQKRSAVENDSTLLRRNF